MQCITLDGSNCIAGGSRCISETLDTTPYVKPRYGSNRRSDTHACGADGYRVGSEPAELDTGGDVTSASVGDITSLWDGDIVESHSSQNRMSQPERHSSAICVRFRPVVGLPTLTGPGRRRDDDEACQTSRTCPRCPELPRDGTDRHRPADTPPGDYRPGRTTTRRSLTFVPVGPVTMAPAWLRRYVAES